MNFSQLSLDDKEASDYMQLTRQTTTLMQAYIVKTIQSLPVNIHRFAAYFEKLYNALLHLEKKSHDADNTLAIKQSDLLKELATVLNINIYSFNDSESASGASSQRSKSKKETNNMNSDEDNADINNERVNEQILQSTIQYDKENNDSLNNEIKQSSAGAVVSCRITRGSYDLQRINREISAEIQSQCYASELLGCFNQSQGKQQQQYENIQRIEEHDMSSCEGNSGYVSVGCGDGGNSLAIEEGIDIQRVYQSNHEPQQHQYEETIAGGGEEEQLQQYLKPIVIQEEGIFKEEENMDKQRRSSLVVFKETDSILLHRQHSKNEHSSTIDTIHLRGQSRNSRRGLEASLDHYLHEKTQKDTDNHRNKQNFSHSVADSRHEQDYSRKPALQQQLHMLDGASRGCFSSLDGGNNIKSSIPIFMNLQRRDGRSISSIYNKNNNSIKVNKTIDYDGSGVLMKRQLVKSKGHSRGEIYDRVQEQLKIQEQIIKRHSKPEIYQKIHADKSLEQKELKVLKINDQQIKIGIAGGINYSSSPSVQGANQLKKQAITWRVKPRML